VTSKLICVLDTNVLLHCRWLEPRDIANLLGEHVDNVQIGIAAILLKELDKHKDDSHNERRQKRARERLKKIEECLESNESVYKYLPLPPPPFWDEHRHEFDRTLGDDQYLATMVWLRNGGSRVVLMSGDTNHRQRAKRNFSIDAPKLLEEWASRPEKTESEKEVQALRTELASYRDREVRLQVELYTDVACLAPPDDCEFLQTMEAYIGGTLVLPKRILSNPSLAGSTYRDEDLHRYNRAIDNYTDELEQLQSKWDDYLAELGSLWICRFGIKNIGRSQSRNVELTLELPDGYEWKMFTAKTIPRLPLSPQRPTPPQPVPIPPPSIPFGDFMWDATNPAAMRAIDQFREDLRYQSTSLLDLNLGLASFRSAIEPETLLSKTRWRLRLSDILPTREEETPILFIQLPSGHISNTVAVTSTIEGPDIPHPLRKQHVLSVQRKIPVAKLLSNRENDYD
jgi:hypothetical protein